MSEPRLQLQPERIDLKRADDPRDVVHRTVASLAQGEGVVIAVDGLVGLAANALHPEAVHRLRQSPLADDGPGSPTLLLRGSDEVADWIPGLTPLGTRLARRAWPGLVTLIYPVPGGPSLLQRLPAEVGSYLRQDGRVALLVPPHPFIRDVLRLLPGPVVFRPLARVGASDPSPIESIGEESGFSLIIESNPGASGQEVTVVRVDPEAWSVVRQGSVDQETLNRMAGTIFLFVCTGNTCRSPMAEAICKVLLAERLGCTVGELESRGFVVLSAGIAAVSGMPAASYAIEVVRARGGSLADHSSRKLTLDLVRHADAILAMTGDHLEALLEHVPEVAPRTRLLHPEGHDVADPVGADRDTYQRTAHAIENYLTRLLDSLGL